MTDLTKRIAALSPEKRELLMQRLNQQTEKVVPTIITAQTRESNSFPLSFAQERLWFIEQLQPGNVFYNITNAVRLQGKLNIAALEQSINEIIRRHEALRTTLTAVEGKPIQVIASSLSLKLSIVDLCEVPSATQEQELQKIIIEESITSFDLLRGPLLRVKLLQLNQTEYVMVFTMHHIVSDIWSMGVLVEEVAVLYPAFCHSKVSPLPELPIQYPDFAVWQRQWLQGQIWDKQLAYWKQQLANPPILRLPTDRPRPAISSLQGATQLFVLSKDLTEALNSLSRSEGVTLFMTLLAAFKVLLHRYTGQEDICVGSPIANRNRAEIEKLIGFFINSLVLRNHLSNNLTFRELLVRVRDVTLGAYDHQDFPFEKVVEELQPGRNLSYNPLFQVVFQLQNTPMEVLDLPDLTLSMVEYENQTAAFDLHLSLSEEIDGEISASLEYSTELFDATTIARMIENFQTLLAGIVANPQAKLSELPLLTETEQHQLLVEWNDTQVEYPLEKCLHQWFEAQVEQTPHAVAVVFENQQLTYSELNAKANQLAFYLRSLGVEADSLVGICVERSLEMLIGILGILKAGGAYVPLDPTYPQERLAFMLEDSQTSILLSQQHLIEKLPPHQGQVICLDSDWNKIATLSSENLTYNVNSHNLAYIIYTSGSTGKPKGVLVNHANVVRLFTATDQWFHFNQQDVWTLFHSYAFDFSVWEIWGALVYGGRLVIVPYWISRSPDAFYNLLSQEQVTVLNQTPSAFRQLMCAEAEANDNTKPLALRLVIFGGEALEIQSVKPWFDRHGDQVPQLVNMYGITETTVHVTYYPLTKADLEHTKSLVGRPIPDLQVYLLDQNRQLVPIGVPGEIYVGGAGVARGYLNRPQLTEERFINNCFANNSTKVYKTGDLARYLPNGEIEYLGRIDHQVKIRGFRIELGEIEASLRQHESVEDALVISKDNRLISYVIPNSGKIARQLVPEVRQYLQAKLPEYMLPSAFVLVDAWPLTVNGKIDRRSLPSPDETRLELEADYVVARNPIEEKLVSIWSEVLVVQQIGVHDNFFNLGGHSLLATQVISRVRDAFNVELPLSCLFTSPTVAGLAESIQTKLQSVNIIEYPPIQPVSRNGDLPLSFAQQRLWFLSQLVPDSSLYNVSAPVRLTGLLDIAALKNSFNEVVQRHEILRTSFVAVEGQPIQVIVPNLDLSLPIVDLQALEPSEQATQVQNLATEEELKPFDLASGFLLRVKLLRLHQTEHILLLTMHHIISDGWSMGILVQELATLYEAFCTGKPNPLPPLPIQYADFAVWQRQCLQGEVLESQLAYWKQQLLGGNLPTLNLPIQRSHLPVPSYKGASYSFELSGNLSQQILELSRQENATLFMTLLAGLQILLYRYTNLDDIVVGTDIANRTQSQTELLIGFFINLLVLRTDMRGNPSFRELLQRVREVTLQAYAHQDLPFDKLVEELKTERDLQQTPLFQVLFVLQNTPAREIELTDLKLHPLETEDGNSKFDLALFAVETEQKISFNWRYKTDLFDETAIARLSSHLQTLLTSIVAQPDTKISSLEMLTPDEIKQQISGKTKRQSVNLQKFKMVKPKAISLTQEQLVKTGYLQPGQTLPFVCQPNVSGLDVIDWAKSNREFLETNLLKHGAILFRGFNTNSVTDFENFAQAICPELFGEYGDLPREGLGGKVYGSTPYPADKAILFHNESSHMHRWPMKIWFYCVQPAQARGETPIVDCRKVYQLLDAQIREKFATKGLMYVRNYTDGLDVSWQNFFHTTDKSAVERFCNQNGIEWEWQAEDGLKTKEIRQAIAKHPKTGEWVFFNQIQLHHIAYLDTSVRESLLSLFDEENLPRNVYYGDGAPIEQSVIDEVTAVYKQAEIIFPWQKGDVLMLDNMLAAHARNPYVGKRKIVVAMGEIVNGKNIEVKGVK
ncbi:amino acid adenylation domain-containing protein [Nostoc sp. XA010]|uniref:non-ribosomal peptide synthetase n=1 Tax=Nostoc sp. XA010 TaxID=2780407 RepID=UPI001E332660|nr:non-ribosomal peptide synthetase [Nostoc sp. XA010]MCC5658374.1 amino acid adenylation domain-containing protein [Nostoc sp. XA010]